MIRKIISDGQSGAGLAALDVAVKLDMPHGGAVFQNHRNGAPSLVDKYDLEQTPKGDCAESREKNVLDSDGTLIISHGNLSEDLSFARDIAQTHHRPCLHVDLQKAGKFDAALKISTWIVQKKVAVLHVTGSVRDSGDDTYEKTKGILESAYHLCFIENTAPKTNPPSYFKIPRTIGEAVQLLDSYMSLKDKVIVANFTADELLSLHLSLGSYISNSFRLWLGNDELLEACRLKAKKKINEITADDASTIIIYELWKTLRRTHKLRVIDGGRP